MIIPPQKKEWFKAMDGEIQTMRERRVPKKSKIIIVNNRWIFTVKRNMNNKIVRYKEQVIAQCFRQKKEIN